MAKLGCFLGVSDWRRVLEGRHGRDCRVFDVVFGKSQQRSCILVTTAHQHIVFIFYILIVNHLYNSATMFQGHKDSKTRIFRAAHTCTIYIWEYPSPPLDYIGSVPCHIHCRKLWKITIVIFYSSLISYLFET